MTELRTARQAAGPAQLGRSGLGAEAADVVGSMGHRPCPPAQLDSSRPPACLMEQGLVVRGFGRARRKRMESAG